MTQRLTLKWGSLKGWQLDGQDECFDLLNQWISLGVPKSAILSRETPEQKEILCKLIDKFEGEIFNDWEGQVVTKEEAKHYIMTYGDNT